MSNIKKTHSSRTGCYCVYNNVVGTESYRETLGITFSNEYLLKCWINSSYYVTTLNVKLPSRCYWWEFVISTLLDRIAMGLWIFFSVFWEHINLQKRKKEREEAL